MAVIPIYGDIPKNRHIAAYGKGANIAFLVYASKTAKSYVMETFFDNMTGEIMQQLISDVAIIADNRLSIAERLRLR